jgi:nitrous oxide reductase
MKQRHIDRSQVMQVLSWGRVIEVPARQAAGDWLFRMFYVSQGDEVTVVVSLDQDENGNLIAVVTVY